MIFFLPLILLQSTVTPGQYQPALPERPPVQNPRTRTTGAPPTDRSARFETCIDQALEDPKSAIITASEWHISGGGWLAKQCHGFALSETGDFAQAAAIFGDAAEAAATAKAPETTKLYAQAGNAALASGDAQNAIAAFDKALQFAALNTGAAQSTANQDIGLIRLDRARALVALNKTDDAKTELALAQTLTPQDPLVWLLSATLARRSGDYARAQADLDVAVKLAPRDPAIALEAGNIAIKQGRSEAARKSWQSAVNIAPDSAEGRAAKSYLAQLDAALQE